MERNHASENDVARLLKVLIGIIVVMGSLIVFMMYQDKSLESDNMASPVVTFKEPEAEIEPMAPITDEREAELDAEWKELQRQHPEVYAVYPEPAAPTSTPAEPVQQELTERYLPHRPGTNPLVDEVCVDGTVLLENKQTKNRTLAADPVHGIRPC